MRHAELLTMLCATKLKFATQILTLALLHSFTQQNIKHTAKLCVTMYVLYIELVCQNVHCRRD